MSRFNPHFPNAEAVFQAAAQWRDRCLIQDRSVFTHENLWTPSYIQELIDHFVKNLQQFEGAFLEKLRFQTEGAAPEAKRLLSEVLWILNLFPSNLGPDAKRDLIIPTWGWSGAELDQQATPLLSDGVLSGVGSGGSGFLNHRWRELRFLIVLAAQAKILPQDDRQKIFKDPWLFNDWVDAIPDEGSRQLKLMLPHLIFPDEFERIASNSSVQKVLKRLGAVDRRRFKEMSKRERDIALMDIRKAREVEGGQVDFYEEPLHSEWALDDPQEPNERTTGGQAPAITEPSPLNQILFGPPGTGKTFQTIDRSVRIIDPQFYASNVGDRLALKIRFDELVREGAIALVTFHQSLSYEDFVEGLKAELDDQGRLRYVVSNGILKQLCIREVKQVFFETGRVFSREYQVLRSTPEILWVRKPNGSELPLSWEMLNEIAALIRDGSVTLEDLRVGALFEKLPNTKLEKYIVNGYKNVLPEIIDAINTQIGAGDGAGDAAPPRVLIIDEINRGNVSRIFGELITLIEPDKRLGAKEQLEVVLPYSKTRFGLPNNLYLIATMNTVDRSLASIDIALRRRFEFEEIEPDPSVLDDVSIDGIELGSLLAGLNARIEVLLDREHRIGHAYFTPLNNGDPLAALGKIFRQKIIPLLQEYFFDDWSRIALVLNDARKAVEDRIIVAKDRGIAELFGENGGVTDRAAWTVNWAALERPGAYESILLP